MTGTTTAPDMDNGRTEGSEGHQRVDLHAFGIGQQPVGCGPSRPRLHGQNVVTAGEMRTHLTAGLLKPHPALAKTESSVYRFKHKKRK